MPRFLLTPSCKLAKFSSPHQSGSSQCMLSSLQKSSFLSTRIVVTVDSRSYSASAKSSADSVSNSNDTINLSAFPYCEIFSWQV